MTIPPPLPLADFWDLLPVAEGTTWRQIRNDELAGMGSADTLAVELASPLWGGDVVLDFDEWPAARSLQARVRALDGPMRTFLMPNPLAEYPLGDPVGAVLGEAEVTLLAIDGDNRRVQFAGLPAGYTLGWGDMGEVLFGSNPERRFVFELQGEVVADGDGETALVPIGPHIWPGVAEGMAVNFLRPAAKMSIVAGSLKEGAIRRGIVEGMSFSVKQRP